MFCIVMLQTSQWSTTDENATPRTPRDAQIISDKVFQIALSCMWHDIEFVCVGL